jgi:hypothetical protein
VDGMAAELQGYSTKVLCQLETCIPSRALDDRYIDGMTIAIVWGEKHEVNRKNDTARAHHRPILCIDWEAIRPR